MTASPSARNAGVKKSVQGFERVSLNTIAEYCKEVAKNTKGQHDLGKLCENLLEFGTVCGDVLYFSNGIKQLTQLSFFFRKRLLKQHTYVVQEIMSYIKLNGAIKEKAFFMNVAQHLDSTNWENGFSPNEKQTHVLRHQAEKLYHSALPTYNKCIAKMYPEFKKEDEDSTRYRIIKVGVDDPPTEIKKKIGKRNVKDLERKFEIRSRCIRTQRQPRLGGRRANSRSKSSREGRVRIRPSYNSVTRASLPLTHENLNQHVRYGKEVGGRDTDPLSWPYDSYMFRETPFEGRRALSDGGFEVESRQSRRFHGRALSDDGGPVYEGSERVYSRIPASELNSYEADSLISTPNFESPVAESGYNTYCRFTPSPPPPAPTAREDDVFTLTDKGFLGGQNVWRSFFPQQPR
jgi:hypothetical protein